MFQIGDDIREINEQDMLLLVSQNKAVHTAYIAPSRPKKWLVTDHPTSRRTRFFVTKNNWLWSEGRTNHGLTIRSTDTPSWRCSDSDEEACWKNDKFAQIRFCCIMDRLTWRKDAR